MKIAFSELEGEELDFVKKNLKGHKMKFMHDPINLSNLKSISDSEVLAIFINSKMPKEVIEKFPNLKLITTMSTGYDHIDLDYCEKKGITVCNVPTYGENTVAEHAFGLILTLSRKIHDAISRTREDNFSVDGLQGFDLKGKTIGVIGTGHIGIHLIRMAKGFEMNVIAYDRFPNKDLAKKIGFKYASFDELLKKSDIMSIHLPLLKTTKYLINMKNVKKIKRGSYLINTSRGEIVETDALVYALDKGILAGAGLDVLEGEANIKEEHQLLKKKHVETEEWETFLQNHFVLKNKNVIVTPHSAFYSKEAVRRITDVTVNNIVSFSSKKPINRVYSRS